MLTGKLGNNEKSIAACRGQNELIVARRRKAYAVDGVRVQRVGVNQVEGPPFAFLPNFDLILFSI
jgi:hypothetical protein